MAVVQSLGTDEYSEEMFARTLQAAEHFAALEG
jgi:hypothetical protein